MESWFSHASGIIISTECGSERPPRCSSSRTSSKEAESEASGVQIGKMRSIFSWSPNRSETSWDSRAAIQFRLPLTVLISPLWATKRYGWASGQLGKVLVENRECTSAIAEAKRRSDRSGKKGSSWPVVSMPL
ncbi:hypothetical protein SVIOM74S_04827 [Streptomyces violarus]